MNPLRLKNVAELRRDTGKTHLKKNLGALDLILLGLGGIIGTGIFVLTGLAAARYSGPAITLSFLLGAVACVFTALAYAELASMLPVAGSAYSYVYATVGELPAFCIGWTGLMAFTFGAATVAAGWSGYIVGLLESFGIHLPMALTKIPAQGGWINLPAALIVGVLVLFLVRGTKDATRLNGILVFVKLATLLVFTLSAIPHVDTTHWQDFSPHGFLGIAAGAGFVFMAYTGFDTLATAAEECKNPNRDLPIGIIGSLVCCAILYVIISGLLTLIVPYASLDNPEPMAFALRTHGAQLGARLVAGGAIAGMTTVIMFQIFGQSRVMMVMARDGLLPERFSRINEKHGSPNFSIVVTSLIVIVISAFCPVSTIGQLSSMATLITFAAVSIAVMIMRYRHPDERRPFVCPAVYGVASISCVLCLFLFAQLLPENWMPYLLTTLVGLVAYFAYGYRNSAHN